MASPSPRLAPVTRAVRVIRIVLARDDLDGCGTSFAADHRVEVRAVAVLRPVRVIDESGEDYLYSKKMFVESVLPEQIEIALLEAA